MIVLIGHGVKSVGKGPRQKPIHTALAEAAIRIVEKGHLRHLCNLPQNIPTPNHLLSLFTFHLPPEVPPCHPPFFLHDSPVPKPLTQPTVAQQFLLFISRGEIVTYGGVAMLLLFLAGAIAVYLVKFLITSAGQPFFSILITLINEVLLIMIVMELLRTVTRLLVSPTHDVGIQDLNPFLVIAGISVTRRILTIGASLSVTETEGQTLDPTKFQHYMIELVISGLLILLVAVSLWLINRRIPGRAAR